MKKIYFYGLIFYIITSLSAQSIEPKESLLTKANKGDTNAMVSLYEHYDYFNYSEGIQDYLKWYDEYLLKSSVFSFFDKYTGDEKSLSPNIIEVYSTNVDKIEDGLKKITKLFEKCMEQNTKQCFVPYMKFLAKNYEVRKNIKKVLAEYYDTLDYELLNSIAKYFYSNNYKKELSFLYTIYDEKKFKKPYFIYVNMYAQEYKDTKREKVIQKVLDTNDVSIITPFARDIYNGFRAYDKGLALVGKAHVINPKDEETLIRLANMYFNIKEYEKAISLYKKNISLHQNINSMERLLRFYEEKKNIKAYIGIKEQLLKSDLGKIALSKYYYSKEFTAQANELLIPLAEDDNIQAQKLLVIENAEFTGDFGYQVTSSALTMYWIDILFKPLSFQKAKQLYRELVRYNKLDFLPKKLYLSKNLSSEYSIEVLKEELISYKYGSKPFDDKVIQAILKHNSKNLQISLAEAYLKRTKQDSSYKEKGLNILEKLEKDGNKEATLELAQYYNDYDNNGIIDMKKSLFYYEKLFNLGEKEYSEILSKAYLCRVCDFKEHELYNQTKPYMETRDYKKALKYTQELEKIYPNIAAIQFAYMYEKGLGLEKDYKKAYAYYEKATRTRSRDFAYARMGYMAKNGLGVKQDYKKAFEIFTQGMYSGSYNRKMIGYELAKMYEKGLGTKKDLFKALEIYQELNKTDDAKRIMKLIKNKSNFI